MCGLAHFFEAEGLTTVIVGFVREQMEKLKPPRGLFLDFPMGRGMGKPNNPKFQKSVIRAAFNLLDTVSGPVLQDFPEVIPVKDGRMGYALPPELVIDIRDIGNVNELAALVEREIKDLKRDYQAAIAFRGRTTVGASQLSIDEFTPYICEFIRGNIPKSPRKGMSPIPLLKLVAEDLEAYFTETRTHRDGIDDLELMGSWFWEQTSAGRMLLSLEAVSLVSDNKVLRQVVEMSLITPRFWSEGPLPGVSGSGW